MGRLADGLRAATIAPPAEEVEAIRREYCEPRNAYERALRAAAGALLEGRLVVNIGKAIHAGGTDANSWTPSLAIAPAHADEVRLRVTGTGPHQQRCSFKGYLKGKSLPWAYSAEVPSASPPYGAGTAVGAVPPLPPRVRSGLPRGLDAYLIMWECV